jgi:hypothetical protein
MDCNQTAICQIAVTRRKLKLETAYHPQREISRMRANPACALSYRHCLRSFLYHAMDPAPARRIHGLLPSSIPLSGVGTTCFHHVVIKIRQLFLRPTACLTSTLLETGVDTNDCKYSRDQQLNVPSDARRSSR